MIAGLPFAPGAVPLIVSVMFVASLVLMVQAGRGLMQQAQTTTKMNRRLKLHAEGMTTGDLIVELRRQRALTSDGDFALSESVAWFNALVTRSGLVFRPRIWALGVVAIALGVGVLAGWRLASVPLGLAIGVVAGLCVPIMVLRSLAKRRAAKLARQLPDALQIVTRSLEAGHPVPSSIALVAREMPDPIGGEFGMAADEISYGVALSQAIARMALRVGDPDVELFAATVRLQERTGGNLCELLEASIDTIRDRQTLRLKIHAATSEGRASAMILTAAPFLVVGLIWMLKPEFYGDVMHNPTFQMIVAGLGFWLLIGNVIMRQMINFKF